MKAACSLLALAVWASACAARADGPPDIVVDRTACSHCGMLISEPIYAAAVRTTDGGERVFDDIGCLLAALPQPSAAGTRSWFHDAADGAWIDGTAAVFVKAASLRTPMGGGTIAFADGAAAAAGAARHNGTVVRSLDELAARKEDR